ncbi:MAG TPA: hypothetical protein VJY62_06050 [Bacteroidia bacterium]|nr:hypothetical protein [Bacteroidia bacterium]
MRKDTRNTITAYLLCIYGIVFIPVFLISFKSAAYGVNLFVVIGFSVITSFTGSMLFYNLKLNMNYRKRVFIYWSLLTLANLFCWIFICDGTFIVRE